MQNDKFSYANLANIAFIDELYSSYLVDQESVENSWRCFFDGFEFAGEERGAVSSGDYRIYGLIRAYRWFGHLLAKVNPIDTHPKTEVKELSLAALGFQETELQKPFPTGGLLPEAEAPLQKIIDTLREIYCNKIGVEYMGLQKREIEAWLQEHIEPSRFRATPSIDQKRTILQLLNKSELFEVFLHTKYVGQKRFSLEGGETLIPILATIIDNGASRGMDDFVIGMAHRGRLNVLANILNKSYSNIFHEFEDSHLPGSFEGSADVKYHKGFSSEITTHSGHQVKVAVPANPSHLESVNPVVLGIVRAKQVLRGDDIEMQAVVPILIHGDAAISGQGVVYESLQFYKLPGYAVGGTIHLVINNQIGFTTLPKDGRSTPQCTDIARTFSAPVFHVNAEDPEGCFHVANLAMQLRQQFHCDVFIDLNCYRKYGHNESDEPAFTQPLEYQLIRKKQTIREMYRDDLIHQGVLEREMAEALEEQFRAALQKELEGIQQFKTEPLVEKESASWAQIKKSSEEEFFHPTETGVNVALLREVAEKFCTIPEGFVAHKKVEHLVAERLAMVRGDLSEKTIDWGMAEHLAFATLLWEGRHVRLSGQDSRRGTFSHRHALWTDQAKEQKYFPLSHLKPNQGRFDVFNSPLSEYAVLGFDFGYSLSFPQGLVIWEAQFGDFCNGGQVIIDQYIAPGEQKWGRLSGLVMLLPHGYEGQGPEHSSGRMERFLQLAGDDNIQVVNPTTPAQFFHLLRRQVIRPLRKPLIVFTPKGLLRHPECVSSLEELTKGSFEEIVDDPTPPKKARRIIVCNGHIYYDLIAERAKRKKEDVAILRIEQLYPLHGERLEELFAKYKGFEECYWVQEEPSNMGAWDFIRPILGGLLGNHREAVYVGRKRSASPAVGSHSRHKKEHAEIMKEAFD